MSGRCRFGLRTVALAFAAGAGFAAHAQDATDASVYPAVVTPGVARDGPGLKPGRPGYTILRQDEDWSALLDPARRTESLDALKVVRLNASGSAYLTTAVDAYVSYRAFDNELNGVFPGYDGTWNTRLNVDLGLTLGERVRLYGALKHGDVYDRRTPPSPVNRDRLDVHQAFAEVGFGDVFGLGARDAFVRVGRQEIHYGNGSLISARLGPNVRSDYDGVLVRVHDGRVLSDAFVYRAVRDRFGVFDDRPDRGNTIWGSYTTLAARPLSVDLIYVGQHAKRSAYATVSGPVDEFRHTVGARLWSAGPSLGGFTVDFEGEYQFGKARPPGGPALNVDAWSIVGLFSRPTKLAWTPTVGLEFGVNSGDRDPNDRTLGTFRAPAPPGRYFGEANAFGPGNIAGFRPYAELHPTPKLRLRPKATIFWRTETTDGTYTLAPGILRGSKGQSSFLGVEPGLETGYTFNPHLSFTGFVAHFQNSEYFVQNAPDRSITYVEATLAFRL